MTVSEDFSTELARTRLGAIADLLEKNGIAVEDVGRIKGLKLAEGHWQAMHKDENPDSDTFQQAIISDLNRDLTELVFTPAWEEGPEWPVVQQAKPFTIRPSKLTPKIARKGFQTAVVLPDLQTGYYRMPDGTLIPIHDEQALDISLQVVRQVRPDVIVLVGDNLDLAEMSRFLTTPAFFGTTQATINRYAMFGAQLEANAPGSEKIHIAGNHDERLATYIIKNATAAFGLRKAGAPESWPVLTVPFLCRFDEWGGTFLPGYPAASYWINNRLEVIHGYFVRKKSTAQVYLDELRHSVMYGHVHRREWEERTRKSPEGPKTIMAHSPGCLCRIDGVVPGVKQGIDHDGVPLRTVENWQQGLSVVHFEPGDGAFNVEPVVIHNGTGFFRDQILEPNVDLDYLPSGVTP